MEGTDEEQLRQSVSGIKTEDLDITTGGYIEDLLRVNIDNVDRNTYHMSQTYLINKIIYRLGLSQSETTPSTKSSLTTKILETFQGVETFTNTSIISALWESLTNWK